MKYESTSPIPTQTHYTSLHHSVTICNRSENAIIKNLKVGKKLFTTRHKPFTITSKNPDTITVRVTTGKSRPFHIKHTALVYHSMKFDRRSLEEPLQERIRYAVWSEKMDILSRAAFVKEAPACIWGILSAMPDVRKDGTELSI